METRGQRLKRLRLAQGLSQRELATQHVGYAYVPRFEADQCTPSGKALQALAEKLGTTALYLETGHDDIRCPHCGREA